VVAAVAVEHSLAGLLHEHVLRRAEPWPQGVLASLRRAQRGDLARGERQIACAGRVLRRLNAAGLRALPLKGAALAEDLYDSLSKRPMADIDILVLDDAPAARRLLRADGFEDRGGTGHAWILGDPPTSTTVELHRTVTSWGRVFSFDHDGLWERRRAGRGCVPVRPGTEDLLVLLATHAAFQHGLGLRLIQYLDFRLLLEREDPSLERAWRIAREAGAEAALALALEAAVELVGAAVPPAFRQALAPALPGSLRGWLARRRRDPRAFLNPGPSDLARLRWSIARGRRAALLREALRGHGRAPVSRAVALARAALSARPPGVAAGR
jgi:hypothetical protein